MHLSDEDIEHRINEDDDFVIDGIEDRYQQIQPSSFDFRLHNEFLRFEPRNATSIDPLEDDPRDFMRPVTIEEDESFTLHPGDFVLGGSIERFEIPDDVVGFVDGRSTMGRLGVIIHATAGLLDSGWGGDITLEMSNLGRVPIDLTPGMRIGQVSFVELKNPAKRPYGEERNSKYQGQTGVQSARPD